MNTRFGSAMGPTLFRRDVGLVAVICLMAAACRPAEAGAPMIASSAASSPEEAGR